MTTHYSSLQTTSLKNKVRYFLLLHRKGREIDHNQFSSIPIYKQKLFFLLYAMKHNTLLLYMFICSQILHKQKHLNNTKHKLLHPLYPMKHKLLLFFYVYYPHYEKTCLLGVCDQLTICLLVSTVDNLCKQFEPRPGPTFCRA